MEVLSKQCENVRVAELKPERSITGLQRKVLSNSNKPRDWPSRLLPQALVPESADVFKALLGVPNDQFITVPESGTTAQSPWPLSRSSDQGGWGAFLVVKV